MLIVERRKASCYPGGAANVARNLTAFVGTVGLGGVTGRDRHGRRLRRLLERDGVDTTGITEYADATTTVKTRVIAGHQHVVRLDRERIVPLTPRQCARLLSHVSTMAPDTDAIIVSDYGKGLLRQDTAEQISEIARRAGTILAVDPCPRNPLRWPWATVMKPNRAQAAMLTCARLDPGDRDGITRIAAALLEKYQAEQVLVTLADQGMVLCRRDAPPYHAAANVLDVFDVSGAGDTAIGLFVTALCGGATPQEATDIGNRAAGVVVGKLGTATLTPGELLAAFGQQTRRVEAEAS